MRSVPTYKLGRRFVRTPGPFRSAERKADMPGGREKEKNKAVHRTHVGIGGPRPDGGGDAERLRRPVSDGQEAEGLGERPGSWPRPARRRRAVRRAPPGLRRSRGQQPARGSCSPPSARLRMAAAKPFGEGLLVDAQGRPRAKSRRGGCAGAVGFFHLFRAFPRGGRPEARWPGRPGGPRRDPGRRTPARHDPREEGRGAQGRRPEPQSTPPRPRRVSRT
jgi:hypothetical protein